MEIISSSHWGILEFLHIIFEFKRHYFFCNWICSLLIMYNHGKYCIFNKIMRVLRYTILYPSFLESALHIDDRMEIILVWNCGGLIIVIITGLSINSKAWQNLAHFGTEIVPMCFVFLWMWYVMGFCMYDSILERPKVWPSGIFFPLAQDSVSREILQKKCEVMCIWKDHVVIY